MEYLTVENKIEILYNQVLSLQQKAEETNEDVNSELHRCYGKLIALTRSTTYHSYYLSFLLAEALLYVEEEEYEIAREIYRQVIEDAASSVGYYAEYIMDAWVNRPAACDTHTESEYFTKAVKQALTFLDTLITGDKPYPRSFILYAKGKLRLGELLYEREMYEQAFFLCEESFGYIHQFIVLLPDEEELINLYLYFAEKLFTFYKEQQKYDEAETVCDKLTEIGRKITKAPGRNEFYEKTASFTNELGCEYEEQRNYGPAIRLLFSSLEFYKKTGDKSDIARIECNIGYLYVRLGKYPEAKEYLWRAESLYLAYQKENPEWNVDGDLAKVYMNQGYYYGQIDRKKDAIEPTRRACQLYADCIEEGQEEYLQDYIMTLSNLAVFSEDLPDRVEMLKRALHILEGLIDEQPDNDLYKREQAVLARNIANTYIQRMQPRKALKWYSKSYELWHYIVNKYPEGYLQEYGESMLSMGVVYKDLLKDEENNILSAFNCLFTALAVFRKQQEKMPLSSPFFVALTLSELADCYKEMGQQQAMENALLDSILLLEDREHDLEPMHWVKTFDIKAKVVAYFYQIRKDRPRATALLANMAEQIKAIPAGYEPYCTHWKNRIATLWKEIQNTLPQQGLL